MAHKRASTGRDRRILALLPDAGGLDPEVREALAHLGAEDGVIHDPAALDAAMVAGLDALIVADGFDHRELFDRAQALALAAGVDAPPYVAIVAADVDPGALEEHPAFASYLARPFRPRTLSALCTSLIEDEHGSIAGSGIAVRRPARFSARPLYGDAVTFARASFDAARAGGQPDLGAARLVAERIHTSLLQSNLLLNRALEPYKRFEIPTHCANVAIVAAKIGLSLDLPLEDRLRLIQIGLLHDVGMARLPDSILFKEGRLTDEERAQMQRHPELGAEIAARAGAEHDWLARAIGQEHERIDGGGYPAGLPGDDIDLLAQIIGLADVFEAFSHQRSYRSPFTAFEALERVVSMRGSEFADEIVDALADEISVFPLDSYVRLSTGAIGRVVESNPDNLMRPTIEVLWNETWSPVEPMIVRLDESPEMAIERPLHESEVPIT